MSVTSVSQDERRAEVGFDREQYLSPHWFEREMEVLFFGSWVYVGHESQIPLPGDYSCIDVADESLIVTRDDAGSVHALVNVCRHRGARICDSGTGSAKRLVCPYHQWTYAMDGALRGAPAMAKTLDLPAWGLRTVAVETWQGLIFVRMSDVAAPTVGQLLSEKTVQFEPFDLRAAKIAASIDYDVAANWKAVYENFLECYHCAANHPEFCQVFDLNTFFAETASRDGATACLAESHLPLRAGVRSLTSTGAFVSKRLLGRYDRYHEADWRAAGDVQATAEFGFNAVVAFPDYALVFAFRPAAPSRTIVHCDWLVAGNARSGRDYDQGRLIELWDITNRQDWALCERTKRGISSRFYLPGPRHPDREPYIAEFTRTYWAQMAHNG